MSSFYDNLALTASRLLNKYGQQVTFTRSVNGSYSPTTGTYSTSSSTTFKAYGAVFNYRESEVDGSSILSTDLKLLLEKPKKLPEVNDVVLVNGSSYFVFTTSPLAPAGTNVVVECQLRIGDKVNELR